MQNDRIPVLDHGYVRLVEAWGSDAQVIASARQSTDGSFRGWGNRCRHCGAPWSDKPAFCEASDKGHKLQPGDEKLLGYLWRHKHGTPFEMAGLTLEVQAPIFVFRQWHRHRTQSYNEISARYTALPTEDYYPTLDRCLAEQGANKQARGATGKTPIPDQAIRWIEGFLHPAYEAAQEAYEYAIKIGIPLELARLSLPVARYSRMHASANLRNWLAFLTLRLDPHAQWETRQFAQAVGQLVAQNFPKTWALFSEGLKDA